MSFRNREATPSYLCIRTTGSEKVVDWEASSRWMDRASTFSLSTRTHTNTLHAIQQIHGGKAEITTGPLAQGGREIRAAYRNTPKAIASRFYQLPSGHALIAPFLKEKGRWTDPEICWWCGGGRQARVHLFKECREWKREIHVVAKGGSLSGQGKGS